MLKAKNVLDLLDIQINLVAEYPDLVEENHDLHDKVEELAYAVQTKINDLNAADS